MLVVQRALIIIIRRGKVFFRFPTDSVQQFDILRGKTREKTGNSKIGLITYTFRAQIIISQQRN